MTMTRNSFSRWIPASAAFAAAAVLLFLGACAGTKPEPVELTDARLALQDARSAGAAQYAAEKLAAAQAHLVTAENMFKADGDAAIHYARLADSEARNARYQAEARKAHLALDAGAKHRTELEVAVRDAEIKALAVRARTDAERARFESEARAREERERSEAAATARETAQRAADEHVRELQARLDAERQKSADVQQQAQIDSLKAQIEEQKKVAEEQAGVAKRQADEQVAAARRVADEERARADETRKQAAEREKTQGDLLVRLQQIERSVRVEPRGIVLTLSAGVYFESSRSDVKPGARERLARIGQALAGASDRKILVEGHTDSTGSAEFNMKLSELRAESVKAILVENAVSPDRIETHGYASTKPVGSNGTPAGRSQNRRVEVVVQGAVR
jgi:outer membrane protein OmpA-like peptidoglycan-associated protein